MLVLSRKKNEVIKIGDGIEVMVVGIERNKVRIGIKAPSRIPVHRQEIYDLFHSEGKIGQNPNTHNNGDEPLEY